MDSVGVIDGMGQRITFDAEWRVASRLQYIYGAALTAIESKVEGDFADFGIAAGTSSQAIAHALARHARASVPTHKEKPRSFSLFDSFEGYPDSDAPADTQNPLFGNFQWKKKRHYTPAQMQALIGNIYQPDLVFVSPGWFEETVKSIPADQKFAFINVDVGLYSSNYMVLSHLFEHGHFSDGSHLIICGLLGPKQYGGRKAWLDVIEKYKPEFTEVDFFGSNNWHCVIHK